MKPTKEEIAKYAEALGVTIRSVYRYLDKIERAKFLIKEITKC
jgi:predicted transcriptional regulator YheO